MEGVNSILAKRVIFPLNDFLTGTGIIRYYTFLQKTQWWSPEKIRDFQNKKLRLLIKYIYENVPYYHKIFRELNLRPSDIKNAEHLSKLPILTKDDVRNNYPGTLLSREYANRQLVFACSGGSTGEPLRFVRNKDSKSQNWGAAFRGWNWAGYEFGDKYVTIFGSPIYMSSHARVKKCIEDFMRRNMFLFASNMNEETLDKFLVKIQRYKPKIIRGYTYAIYLLARYMEQKGNYDIDVRAVLTTSEKLFDNQKEVIESQFNCEVFDEYGSGEIFSIAYECEEHSGYHITQENLVVEFLKDNNPVSPGEMGKIIITDLTNYAVPLIRYEIGDLGIPSGDLCACGRGLSLVKSIEGRTGDIIVTPSNRFLALQFFVVFFSNYVEGITQFQVVQESIDSLLIKLVTNSNFNENDAEYIRGKIQQYAGDDMNVTIKFVDNIKVSKSGKHKFVISKIKDKI
jgi:phenylacetate-CoA ligase